MQVMYALTTTWTDGRALAISTCYTSSAGSWLAPVSQPTRWSSSAPEPDMAVSVHIAANGGRKWSCSWASRSLRPLWRCLPELHQKHSHCTACGCVISSAAALIAPQAGTEHLSSTSHLACAERMGASQSTAQPRRRHQPALTGWAGLDWCVAAATCRSALDETRPSSRDRYGHFRPL